MALSPIGSRYASAAPNSAASASSSPAAETVRTEDSSKESSKADKDTFVKSSDAEKPAGTTQKKLTAAQLEDMQNQQIQSFQKMLSSILTSQADKSNVAKNGMGAVNADLFSRLTVTPEQQAAAQQAVSEDGEWGVNAVATRIMDMAVSLSGGDSSKVSELRAAVEKGFKQAGFQWGQKLPSVCQDTYSEIEKRFDYWEERGSLDGYEYASAEKQSK